MSVPIEHTEDATGVTDHAVDEPVSDEHILDAIGNYYEAHGRRPGRDKLKELVPGVGSGRASRLLKDHAQQSGEEMVTTAPALRAVPDRADDSGETGQQPATDRADEVHSSRAGDVETGRAELGSPIHNDPGDPADQGEHDQFARSDEGLAQLDRAGETGQQPATDRADDRAANDEPARADTVQPAQPEPGEFARWSQFGRELLGRKLADRASEDRTNTAPSTDRMPKTLWVVAGLVALPALVSIWAGWVSLGLATGWKEVQLFPSVPGLNGVHLNTVIFLPFSVEVLTIVSMGFFLHYRGKAIRRVAGITALATVALGLFGQAWSHHLQATGAAAPSWLVVFTSGLPVVAMALVGLLVHLARNEHARTTQGA